MHGHMQGKATGRLHIDVDSRKRAGQPSGIGLGNERTTFIDDASEIRGCRERLIEERNRVARGHYTKEKKGHEGATPDHAFRESGPEVFHKSSLSLDPLEL